MMKMTSAQSRTVYDTAMAQKREAEEKALHIYSSTMETLRRLCAHDETLMLHDGSLFCRGCFADVAVAA